MKKKVLILANSDVGLYNFRKELIVRLLVEGFLVFLSVPFGPRVPELVALGCSFIETPVDRRGKNLFRDLSQLKHYCKILHSIRPNAVVTYTIKPNLYGGLACRLKKVPYIANITGLGTAFQKSGLLQIMVMLLHRLALKTANRVVFENADNYQFFLNKRIVEHGQSACMPGAGVNLNEFPFMEMVFDGTCRFLFIGRIMKEKGIDELFEAAKTIRKTYKNASFEFIGQTEDNYSAVLKQQAADGVLQYHGFQGDVRPFVSRCHCVVLPSYHEGMSNALLEAAAMGRPLIASDIPGCREAVQPDVSGFLCDAKSSQSLARCLERFILLDDVCKLEMGMASRKHVEDVFDRKQVVEAIVNLIKAISQMT